MRRSIITRAATGAIALAFLSGPAGAASFSTATLASARSGLQAMRELNVITIGNLNSNSHVQGKAFVGGSLYGAAQGYATTGAAYAASNATFGQGNVSVGASASSRPTLAVAGGSYTSFTLQDGQNGSAATNAKSVTIGKDLAYTSNVNPDNWSVKVGGNLAAIQNVNGGPAISYGGSYAGSNTGNGRIARDATLAAGGTGDLAAALAMQAKAMQSDLGNLSTVLGSLDNSGTRSAVGSTITFDFSSVTTGYGAYTIAASDLFSYGTLDLKLGGTALPVVINVTGSGQYTDSLNMNLGDALAQQVIFNFVDATGLAINANFTGSLLATKAVVTNSSNITGSVAAGIFDQNAEVHLGTFAGNDRLIPQGAPTPEPGTWAMMVLGFGAVGGAIRRRRTNERQTA